MAELYHLIFHLIENSSYTRNSNIRYWQESNVQVEMLHGVINYENNYTIMISTKRLPNYLRDYLLSNSFLKHTYNVNTK